MDPIPFEFPEAAFEWSDVTEASLESRLFQEIPANTQVASNWDEPDDPLWSILIARWLCEEGGPFFEETQGNSKHKAILEQFLTHLVRWFRQAISVQTPELSVQLQRLVLVQHVATLYRKIHGLGLLRFEGNLLQVLFASGHSTAIKLGVDFLLTIPPANWSDVSLALSPLVQSKFWNIEDVFPKLLQSDNPSVLSPALDVANHAFRSRSLTVHPANEIFASLLQIMGGLVNQLGVLEENPSRFGNSVAAIQKILFDSVSLCVSLCDTLGLVGNQDAIGKLNQASRLSHRRIRSEAAFALAKLGDKNGEKLIIDLANDFSCRQRVIAYAEELGIEDKIDEQWTTAAALAESRLANWLSQNEQMGIAPSRMELLDQRTLSWPGFDQPQECFLFRYEYDLHESIYSNVGFAGPMSHTFSDDLANISMEDAFAIFAGWDIDHPDAFELPAEGLLPAQWKLVQGWIKTLEDRYENLELIFFGSFFEHAAILVRATHEGETRILVFDGEKVIHEPFPKPGVANPTLTYLLWRGRVFFESVS